MGRHTGHSGCRAADVSGTRRLRQQFVHLDRQPGRRIPHHQRGRDPGGQRDQGPRRAHVQVRLPGHTPARKRHLRVAAVGHLHVSIEPQRQSTDTQYGQFLRDARTRCGVGGELHAADVQLSAPLVAESILCAGRLENSPRSDIVDRPALQPGVARQHAVRAEIGVRSECDRSRERSQGRHYASQRNAVQHQYPQFHASARRGVELQAAFCFSRFLRDVYPGPGDRTCPG